MLSIEQLRNYPIFAGLTEVELSGVPPILKKRAFADGAYIYYPGNPGLHSYLVKSGQVRLFLCTAAGQEMTLKLIGPQEVFGLPLLDDEQVRLTGAVVYQPSILYSIMRKDLLQLMDRSPRFMRNIYQDLVTDARRLLLHLRSLATLNLNGRIAAMLLRLARMTADGQYLVDMPLNQEEFASWLGASRGRLNQAIHQFEDIGLIRLEESEIVIQDYPGLERISEEQTIEEV
jgi:CRP/FNR family cyclic AMP-dependent transcriptional regulator